MAQNQVTETSSYNNQDGHIDLTPVLSSGAQHTLKSTTRRLLVNFSKATSAIRTTHLFSDTVRAHYCDPEEQYGTIWLLIRILPDGH